MTTTQTFSGLPAGDPPQGTDSIPIARSGSNYQITPAGLASYVSSSGNVVSQIVAGSNVTISPSGGTGVVTINATGGGGVTQLVAGSNIVISPSGGTGVVTVSASGSLSNNITINSSTVTGGTSGYILYDNAGVLGNLATTGTGSVVQATSPTLVTPALGTPTALVLTNATGLALTTGVTGLLPVASGGTGTSTPALVAGTNVTITGSWPNQTINASGGGGGGSPAGSNTQIQTNDSGTFGAAPIYSGTAVGVGNDVSVSMGINNGIVPVASNGNTPNATLTMNAGTAQAFVIAGYSSNIGNSPAYDAFFTSGAYLGNTSGAWIKQGGVSVKPTVLRLGGYGGGASFYTSNSSNFQGETITDFSLALDIGPAGGVVVGTPTGNNKGAGSLNAQSLYVNGVAVSTGGGGVSQIIAGTNVTISPSGGTGAVTINATAGSTIPGGDNGALQYNYSETFGGIPNWVWSGTALIGTQNISTYDPVFELSSANGYEYSPVGLINGYLGYPIYGDGSNKWLVGVKQSTAAFEIYEQTTGAATSRIKIFPVTQGNGIFIGDAESATIGQTYEVGAINATNYYINGVPLTNSGGSPGGASLTLQYNNSGSFAGSSLAQGADGGVYNTTFGQDHGSGSLTVGRYFYSGSEDSYGGAIFMSCVSGSVWGGTVGGQDKTVGLENKWNGGGGNMLFTVSSFSTPVGSIQVDGSLFAGGGLPTAPFGVDATSVGYVVAQNGVCIGFPASGTNTGLLKLANASTPYVITLNAGSTAADYQFVLPTTEGSAGQVLTNTGAGVTTWATPSSSSRTGAYVQTNPAATNTLTSSSAGSIIDFYEAVFNTGSYWSSGDPAVLSSSTTGVYILTGSFQANSNGSQISIWFEQSGYSMKYGLTSIVVSSGGPVNLSTSSVVYLNVSPPNGWVMYANVDSGSIDYQAQFAISS